MSARQTRRYSYFGCTVFSIKTVTKTAVRFNSTVTVAYPREVDFGSGSSPLGACNGIEFIEVYQNSDKDLAFWRLPQNHVQQF